MKVKIKTNDEVSKLLEAIKNPIAAMCIVCCVGLVSMSLLACFMASNACGLHQ